MNPITSSILADFQNELEAGIQRTSELTDIFDEDPSYFADMLNEEEKNEILVELMYLYTTGKPGKDMLSLIEGWATTALERFIDSRFHDK